MKILEKKGSSIRSSRSAPNFKCRVLLLSKQILPKYDKILQSICGVSHRIKRKIGAQSLIRRKAKLEDSGLSGATTPHTTRNKSESALNQSHLEKASNLNNKKKLYT